ncbi:PAS domain-containing sensor histidine kinase, partial [bacterium]|nr:PAS domain-containing sensor histidine kinase [bacterium]
SSRIHPEDQADVFRKLAYSHQPWSSSFYEAEYRMKTKGHRWIWVLARGRVTEWGNCGEPVRMIGVMQDVTVRKELETQFIKAKEDAEAADRTKSEFLAAMSHELRTPLNSIIGFTNLLLKRPACRQHISCEEFLKRISDNGIHLLGLINDILDLSKIEAGRTSVKSQVVDVVSLIESISLQFSYQFHKRGIDFNLNLPEEAVYLQTDKQKLRQIMQNLISNALKFTNEGHVEIKLKTSPVSGHPVYLEVTDTGVGIPSDRISKIFLAFQQGEAGTARKYNGTGLGLAICQSLSQLLGYKLEVESTLRKGSTFRLLFEVPSN